LVRYVNHSTKVEIVCPEHGIFLQSPNNHMTHKKGCPKCNGGIRYTEEVFFQKSKEIHGEKFTYNIKKWKDSNTKIEILCEKKHKFMQLPTAHLRGQGCPKCKLDAMTYDNEKFTELSRISHGDKYDYSLVEYKSSKIKVSIKCNKCNDVFFQTPRNHLYGQGCPKCCNKSVSKIENSWLDYLGIPYEYRHKTIRINNKNFFVDALVENTIYEFYGDYWHGNPNKYDRNDLNKSVSKKFGELFENTKKREIELLNNGYKIISIWETDFKKIKNNNDKNI
jgi:Zn finger protein HypA/HybF involved in hydrogenase expression